MCWDGSYLLGSIGKSHHYILDLYILDGCCETFKHCTLYDVIGALGCPKCWFIRSFGSQLNWGMELNHNNCCTDYLTQCLFLIKKRKRGEQSLYLKGAVHKTASTVSRDFLRPLPPFVHHFPISLTWRVFFQRSSLAKTPVSLRWTSFMESPNHAYQFQKVFMFLKRRWSKIRHFYRSYFPLVNNQTFPQILNVRISKMSENKALFLLQLSLSAHPKLTQPPKQWHPMTS